VKHVISKLVLFVSRRDYYIHIHQLITPTVSFVFVP